MFSFRKDLGLHTVQAVYMDSAVKVHPSNKTDFLTLPVTSMYPVSVRSTQDYSGPTGGSEASSGGIVITCTSQLLVCVFGCAHIHLCGVKVETEVSPLETNSSGLGRATLGAQRSLDHTYAVLPWMKH